MTQERWLIDAPRTIDVGRIRTLKVTLAGGQIDIVGHDEPEARVEIHSVDGREMKVGIDGDTLEIDHPQLGWDNILGALGGFRGRDRAEVSVMVPRDVKLRFSSVSAGALFSGLRGDAGLHTVDGELVIDGHEGDLSINSVGGEVVVRGHRGALGVHTVSGDLTASGALTRVAIDSVSAETLLDITGTPGTVRVNTVSGGTSARFEQGVPVRYTLRAASGRLHVDGEEVATSYGSIEGRTHELGSRWVDLVVNSAGGGVTIAHAQATAEAPA